MKKVAIVFAVVLFATSAFAADKSWSGFVSDLTCSTKENAKTAGHAACAKSCLGKEGAKAALVTDDGAIVKIANLDKVKEFAGAHVTVTGKLEGETLTVDKVTPDKK